MLLQSRENFSLFMQLVMSVITVLKPTINLSSKDVKTLKLLTSFRVFGI